MRRFAHLLLGAFLAACTLALVWPGYGWAGTRVEPWVMGVPFSLAWVGAWAVATFVALAVYHLATDGGADD